MYKRIYSQIYLSAEFPFVYNYISIIAYYPPFIYLNKCDRPSFHLSYPHLYLSANVSIHPSKCKSMPTMSIIHLFICKCISICRQSMMHSLSIHPHMISYRYAMYLQCKVFIASTILSVLLSLCKTIYPFIYLNKCLSMIYLQKY